MEQVGNPMGVRRRVRAHERHKGMVEARARRECSILDSWKLLVLEG